MGRWRSAPFSPFENQISDAGMQAFAKALANGAMANCQELWLSENQIGNIGMEAFAEALANGAMANCQKLYLHENQIGDVGMTAFAQAIKPVSEGDSGALAQCQELDLHGNQIGDTGMAAFAKALANGAMASLDTLYVDDGPLGTDHPALKVECEARGIVLS